LGVCPAGAVASGQADELLRFLVWRILGLIAFLVAIATTAWLLDGGPGAALRGTTAPRHLTIGIVASAPGAGLRAAWRWSPVGGLPVAKLAVALTILAPVLLAGVRQRSRARRRYVRMRVQSYRTDTASAEAVVLMFEALHKRMLRRWWRRLCSGQPSVAVEVHHAVGSVWLAVTCPEGLEAMVQAALSLRARARTSDEPVDDRDGRVC
jgi:hypothetical protein